MKLEYSISGTPYIQLTKTDRLSFSKLSKINGTYNRLFFSGIEISKYKGEPIPVRLLTDMQMEGTLLKARRCECYMNGTLKGVLKRIKKYLNDNGFLPENMLPTLEGDVIKIKPKEIKPKRKRKLTRKG